MKKLLVNGKHEIMAPDHIADWDAPTHWERGRFNSMEQRLKKGNVLFDVGTEQGWISAVYAKYFVGPENMVLIEPDGRPWPNIKQTWDANEFAKPKGMLWGSFGNRTTSSDVTSDWPAPAEGELQVALGYGSLREGAQMRLDDYVEATKIVPDAVTIDVEGACLEVLRGARRTLKERGPLVWVSVHPDLMENYDATEDQLHDYMTHLGYEGQHLETDHEQHWLYEAAA